MSKKKRQSCFQSLDSGIFNGISTITAGDHFLGVANSNSAFLLVHP